MNAVRIKVVSIAFVLGVSVLSKGSVAHAADPVSRLSVFQRAVKPKASGAYEVGDDLYVHVRMPAGKAINVSRAKFKAVSEAKLQLKRWAVAATSQIRGRDRGSLGAGWRKCADWLDSVDPCWRLCEWDFAVKGQEISVRDGSDLLYCQVYARQEVVDSLPPSLMRSDPDMKALVFGVQTYVTKAFAEDPDRLRRELFKGCERELEALGAQLDEYRSKSEYATRVRKQMGKVAGPVVAERWEEQQGDPVTEEKSVVSVRTNGLACVTVVTNVVVRVQSEPEIAHMGLSADGKVSQSESIEQMEEVVTILETVTTKTTRTVRRRKMTAVSGYPEFERHFLGLATAAPPMRAQTSLGAEAVKAFYGTATGEKRRQMLEMALCQNVGDKELWNLLGRTLHGSGDVKGALICYGKSLELQPDYQYALTNMAIACKELGFQDLATSYAVLARGVARDKWCLQKCDEILK